LKTVGANSGYRSGGTPISQRQASMIHIDILFRRI